ncbi:MAG: DUF6597 domain-containing transcriptional factor, partial [Polyangiaceae bacterium]
MLESKPSLGHLVFPDGCSDFLFDLTSGRSSLVGVMSEPITTPPSGLTKLVGIRFRPGEAYAFLGCAASEVRDGFFALTDALGSSTPSLCESLIEAESTKELISKLDSALLGRT